MVMVGTRRSVIRVVMVELIAGVVMMVSDAGFSLVAVVVVVGSVMGTSELEVTSELVVEVMVIGGEEVVVVVEKSSVISVVVMQGCIG